jgi:23S rRNA pseudouridine2605 synthase
MEKIRIQKWMSQLGIASRREAERWISEGRVSVNGEIVTEQGLKVDPEMDRLEVDGNQVSQKKPPRVYWMLHKPKGVVTSRKGFGEQHTIYDLDKLRNLPFLVSPIGRLDFNTEGLLLLSNDGELANRLSHPNYKVAKHYQIHVKGKLTDLQLEKMQKGVELEDGKTLPCKVKYTYGEKAGKDRGSWYMITVYEGRNRLVRRLFEHFGLEVMRLVRYAYGDINLPDDLKAGDYIQLSKSQVQSLKKSVGME